MTGEIQVPIVMETVEAQCVLPDNVDNRCREPDDKIVKTTKQGRAPLTVRANP